MNIKAGTLHFDYLMQVYSKQGIDSANSIKFALAAYNLGESNVKKIRQKAKEEGYDSNDWDEVKKALGDGYISTRAYIYETLELYDKYKRVID